jgi:hypothetical protein
VAASLNQNEIMHWQLKDSLVRSSGVSVKTKTFVNKSVHLFGLTTAAINDGYDVQPSIAHLSILQKIYQSKWAPLADRSRTRSVYLPSHA